MPTNKGEPFSRVSLCSGVAMTRMAGEIEDRIGWDHDHVQEPMIAVGARYRLNAETSLGVDWRGGRNCVYLSALSAFSLHFESS